MLRNRILDRIRVGVLGVSIGLGAGIVATDYIYKPFCKGLESKIIALEEEEMVFLAEYKELYDQNTQMRSLIHSLKTKEIINIDLKERPTLEAMVKGFESMRDPIEGSWKDKRRSSLDFYSEQAIKHSPMEYSASDVGLFSLLLVNYQDTKNFSQKAGVYLNTLMRSSSSDNFILHTFHLKKKLDFLGHLNDGKNIIILGDAGNYSAYGMKKGSFSVHGNVGNDFACLLSDGEVSVKGSAGDNACYAMKGGQAYIAKNVGRKFGGMLKGGVAIADGNAGDLAAWCQYGGKILIFKDVGSCAGQSKYGGHLLISGKAAGFVGYDMHGGFIQVDGDAGHSVAQYADGGNIVLGSTYDSIGDWIRGIRIFHKNKLIFEKKADGISPKQLYVPKK